MKRNHHSLINQWPPLLKGTEHELACFQNEDEYILIEQFGFKIMRGKIIQSIDAQNIWRSQPQKHVFNSRHGINNYRKGL